MHHIAKAEVNQGRTGIPQIYVPLLTRNDDLKQQMESSLKHPSYSAPL